MLEIENNRLRKDEKSYCGGTWVMDSKFYAKKKWPPYWKFENKSGEKKGKENRKLSPKLLIY